MHVQSTQYPRYEDAACVRSIGVHRLLTTDRKHDNEPDAGDTAHPGARAEDTTKTNKTKINR